jgi:hypothetical protein
MVTAWLARYLPASHGRQVYVSGPEAFWIEHVDVDGHDAATLTAAIHAEIYSGAPVRWRSTYELTRFDCESQQQRRYYLTRYTGTGLTGEMNRTTPMFRTSEFIAPTSADFAHIRAVCLSVYDRARPRTYVVSVPVQ